MVIESERESERERREGEERGEGHHKRLYLLSYYWRSALHTHVLVHK